MSCTVNIDWRFIVALGIVPACIILANKIDPEAAERVLTQVVNIYKVDMLAIDSKC